MVKGLVNFIKETRQELSKVTWPSREELQQATVVVIITTLLMAVYIGAIDACLSVVMRVLLRG
ncbi:MAG: preprotein translocase subunit SecE [Candidatus Omnitrophota bacterium]